MSYPQQPGWSDPTSAPGGPDLCPQNPGGYLPPQPAYPAYPYPGYPGYPGYGAPMMVPAQPTNGMAIAALVLALSGLVSCGLTSLVGAVLGHVARRQIRERGEAGDGLALAGIIVGWILFAIGAVGIGGYAALAVWLAKNGAYQN